MADESDFEQLAATAGLSGSFEVMATIYQWYMDALGVGFSEAQAFEIAFRTWHAMWLYTMQVQQQQGEDG